MDVGFCGMWSKLGVQTPTSLLPVKAEVSRHKELCLEGQLGLYNFYYRNTHHFGGYFLGGDSD